MLKHLHKFFFRKKINFDFEAYEKFPDFLASLDESKIVVHTILPSVIEIPEEPKDDLKAAFLHTKRRIRERYGYYLKRIRYDYWLECIKRNDSEAIFIETRPDGTKLYMFAMYNKDIYLVYNVHTQVILTALSPNNRNRWKSKAISSKPKIGKASKQAGRGNLDNNFKS